MCDFRPPVSQQDLSCSCLLRRLVNIFSLPSVDRVLQSIRQKEWARGVCECWGAIDTFGASRRLFQCNAAQRGGSGQLVSKLVVLHVGWYSVYIVEL